jgi:hypothetical protein
MSQGAFPLAPAIAYISILSIYLYLYLYPPWIPEQTYNTSILTMIFMVYLPLNS